MDDIDLINILLKEVFPYGKNPTDYYYLDAVEDLNKINNILHKELFRTTEHDDYILIVWDLNHTFPDFYEHITTDTTKQDKLKETTRDIINKYSKLFLDYKDPDMPIYISSL